MTKPFPGQIQEKKTVGERGAYRHQQGFTLLEVMVSLSLMVVLFSLLYGGFGFGYRAWDSANKNTVHLSEYQSTYRIVGGWLSQFYPATRSSGDQRVSVDTATGNKHYAFYGTASRVYFTAFMPSYPTRGGLYEVLFSIEKEEGTDGPDKFMVNRRFFDSEQDIMTPFNPDQRVILLEEVDEAARFEYFGRKAKDTEPLWYSEWREFYSYPTLIRLRFSEGGQTLKEWPDLFIPVRVDHNSICIHPQPDDRKFCDAVRWTNEMEGNE